MNRAVIYCRVSTKEQTQNLSLPTQRKECEAYCHREGVQVDRVFMEEGESAKTADRPRLRELLEYCRKNKKRIRYVIVYSLSRFSRESGAHHALRAILTGLGIVLRSVTEPIDETPPGRLMESMFASIAQFDNDVRADRTKVGMRAALETGRWTFQAPIGYRTGVRGGPSLVPDPVQAPLVRELFEAFASGADSAAELRERMRVRGLATRRGGPLSAQTLRAMLRNPIYVGRAEVPRWGISVPGDFEAIVTESLFSRVQGRLRSRKDQKQSRSKVHPDFPLRRFVSCAHCSRPLTGSWSRSRDRRYAYYHCANCGRVRVQKTALESKFVELLASLQPQREYLRLFDAIVLDAWKEKMAASRQASARLQQSIDEHRGRLDHLDEEFLYRRSIDQTTYARQRDRLRERVALLEVELAEAVGEELDVEGVLAFARTVLLDAANLWKAATVEQKLRLQAVFFPEGLRFDGSAFGTAVTCLAFTSFAADSGAQDGVASPTGFELCHPTGNIRHHRFGTGAN